MKILQSISTLSMTINYNETDPIKKFPELVNNIKQMILQKDSEVYLCNIKYSYTSNWIVINITNQNEEILQQNTYVANYPINLSVIDDLLGYGLFFNKNTFTWAKLPDDFYNLNQSYEEILSELTDESI